MVVYSTNMNRALPSPGQVFRALPCYCGRLLLATRAITRLYNDELRPAGIEGTQLLILHTLADWGPMTQNQLGERMAAGKTTVSRNLKLLQKRRWLAVEEGEDRRCRLTSLTESGRRQIKKARPYWERAQQRMQAAMPRAQLEALFDLLPVAAEAALRA
jgi:DNA-binding MarR family transcriptional regulator